MHLLKEIKKQLDTYAFYLHDVLLLCRAVSSTQVFRSWFVFDQTVE